MVLPADIIFGTDVVQQGDTSLIPANQCVTDLKKRLQFSRQLAQENLQHSADERKAKFDETARHLNFKD